MRLSFCHLPLLAILLLCGQPAVGKDIRVPGDQGTLTAAIQSASPGDRIVVSNNQSFAAVHLDKAISLVSEPAGATIRGGEKDGVTIGPGANKVMIEGFRILESKAGLKIEVGSTPTELVLKDVVCEANREEGVKVEGKSRVDLSLSGCSLSRNSLRGLVCFTPANVSATRCKFSENGTDGIALQGPFYNTGCRCWSYPLWRSSGSCLA